MPSACFRFAHERAQNGARQGLLLVKIWNYLPWRTSADHYGHAPAIILMILFVQRFTFSILIRCKTVARDSCLLPIMALVEFTVKIQSRVHFQVT